MFPFLYIYVYVYLCLYICNFISCSQCASNQNSFMQISTTYHGLSFAFTPSPAISFFPSYTSCAMSAHLMLTDNCFYLCFAPIETHLANVLHSIA